MFGLFKSNPQGGMSLQDIIAAAQNGDITVVDVRDQMELTQTGKANGAVHIPLAVIQMQTDPRSPDFHADLDPSKPVAVYCASGARSNMAAQVLMRNGFEQVMNIGGLGHWAQAGGQVVPA